MYVTDLTHFLDESGEIPKTIPKEARELASFLALVVDGMTSQCSFPDAGVDVGVRCRKRGCPGVILAAVGSPDGPIDWGCTDCDQEGLVSNWQGSKWDNSATAKRSQSH